MKITESKIRYLWLAVLVIIPAMVWVFGFQHSGFAAYIDTAHGDPSFGVKRTGHTDCPQGTACQMGDCTHCHDAFNPDICGVKQEMLFADLDSPDFCMKCHTNSGSVQVGGMSGAPASIPSVFSKTYRHNVTGYSGLHKFSPKDETRVYLSANKHVECDDCHNPHGADSGLHNELASNAGLHLAAVSNEIALSGPLKGAFGVEPTAWGSSNWSGASSWPLTSTGATKEYQICFKCHSNYNSSFSSWGGSGAQAWTNVALELNPKNGSYHPAVQSLPDTDPGNECCSDRLPAPFTSLLIGDSGYASTLPSSFSLTIDSAANGKTWTANQWLNWGLRLGTIKMNGDTSYNQVGRITANTTTGLSISWQALTGLGTTYKSYTVYSIEYYAGMGSKSGLRITDTYKNFHQYLPSLAGYWVVISSSPGSSQKIAIGRVVQSQPTWFEVDQWTAWQAPTGVPIGGVPADGTGEKTVSYYFSATGKTLMCSDCHSNNEISGTAAQGPHGSTVKWMLKGRNRAWPTLLASENGTGTGTLRQVGNTGGSNHRSIKDGNPDGNGLFCLNCHSTVSFSKNKYGIQDPANVHYLHLGSSLNGGGPGCANCHILVPHGGKLSRLIGDQDGTMPSRYAFNNDPMRMWVRKFWKCGDPAGYAKTVGRGSDWCSVRCHFPDGSEYDYHSPNVNGDDW